MKTSDGYRDSTVRKVSDSGLFWTTTEVETLGDGMRGTKTDDGGMKLAPETFKYTIPADRPDLKAKAEAVAPGQRVRIKYRRTLTVWLPRGETNYFITDIQVIK